MCPESSRWNNLLEIVCSAILVFGTVSSYPEDAIGIVAGPVAVNPGRA